MTTCKYCFGLLVQKGCGRIPVFCSNACKQAHWRLEKNGFQRTRVSASVRSISLLNDEQPKSLSEILESARAFGTLHCLSCSTPFRSDLISYVRAQRLKISNRAFVLFCHSGCSSKFYSGLNESLRNAGSFSQVDWVETL